MIGILGTTEINRYISDLHLGHGNILYSRPQFKNVEEMNETIINNWNECVNEKDHVWICGDFSYRSKIHVGSYLGRLKGHKHLIIGNHDIKWMKNCNLDKYFDSVQYMAVIKDRKRSITLCHYPMMEWPGSRYAKFSLEDGHSFLIHGHIHNSTTCDAYKYIRKSLPCALNCCVDINDYRPVTFEELFANNSKWYGRLD